jgi:hypothetical protein|tara:strand:+ start:11344 stop:11541 length:198 start_codon:yes stop_codon:yes gene_type:complete
MDTNKWKSIAVRITDYQLLKGICKNKFRAPGAMISKLIDNHITYEAKKLKVTPEVYKKKLLNGTG